MIYGSVCSGIEAATVAWHPLGWVPAWFAEVDPAASAVLAHHYPETPNLGDFTKIEIPPGPAIDLLVGGTPCQAFSVAGLRKGLGDDRGNLALEFLRLAGRLRPRWVAWENVPGVLSSVSHHAPDPCPPPPPLDMECDGQEVETEDYYGSEELHAFNCFLAGLQELGYGWAYRVLDAQYFGVPQRRRRVFVVGYLGDWRRAAAVLFERHSLSGNPPPGREAGARVAGSLEARTTGGGFPGTDGACGGYLTPVEPLARTCEGSGQRLDGESDTFLTVAVADTLKGHHPRGREDDTYIAHTLRGDGFDASEDGTGRGTPLVPVNLPIPIDMRQASRGGTMTNNRAEGFSGGAPGTGIGEAGDPAPSLSLSHPPAIAYQCHGSNVGPMGTVRAGNGNEASGVPFIVNAAESCATQSHARPSEVARCLDGGGSFATAQGGTVVISKNASAQSNTLEYQANTSTEGGPNHAHAVEVDAGEVLRAVRVKAGEEAFQEWGLGVLASLLPPEVLRALMHGGQFRCPPGQGESFLGHRPPPREEGSRFGSVREVWEAGRLRCPPPQWGLDGQLARELGAAMSLLPHQGTPSSWLMRDLWGASEGLGLLRQALSAVQEAWRSAEGGHADPEILQGMRRAGTGREPVRSPLHAAETSESHDLIAHSGRKEVRGVSAVRRLTPL